MMNKWTKIKYICDMLVHQDKPQIGHKCRFEAEYIDPEGRLWCQRCVALHSYGDVTIPPADACGKLNQDRIINEELRGMHENPSTKKK